MFFRGGAPMDFSTLCPTTFKSGGACAPLAPPSMKPGTIYLQRVNICVAGHHLNFLIIPLTYQRL